MAIAVLVVVGLVIISSVLSVLQSRKSRQRAAEEVRRAALRGWNLKTSRSNTGMVYLYSGRTDGIDWRFTTYVSSAVWQGPVSARWETEAVKLDNDFLAILPSFGKPDVKAVPANSPTLLVQLLSQGFAHFVRGDAVDQQNFSRAQVVTPAQAGLERYWFRATRPELMQRFLDAAAGIIFARPVDVLLPTRRQGLKVFSVGHTGMHLAIICRPTLETIAEIAKLGSALATAAQKAIDSN